MRKTPASRNQADYAVGWGRPPKSKRWKVGQSGNPKGRPRAKKNQVKLFNEALERKIQIEENGKVRTITIFEAIIRRFVGQALKGDLKAIKFLLDMKAELPEPITMPEKITPDMSAESLTEIYRQMVQQIR
jgi:Family of unknown function (DUF5681)